MTAPAAAPLLLRAAALIPGGGLAEERPGRLLVRDGVIVATGAPAEAVAGAEVLDLGQAVLLPGFVNAHQHGRGLSQILLGYPDDRLEAWANRRRGRGSPDPFPLVRLAALRMLANGVTACLHANWSYGGDQEAELHATLRGYDAAGIRATVMVGVADRGALLYPPFEEAGLLRSLDGAARAVADASRRHAFPGSAAAAAEIHDRLRACWAGHDRLSLGFGPAGPQWVSDRLFADVAAAAAERAVPLHFHLLESPPQRSACAALYPEGTVARLAALGVLGPRSSAAHGVFLSDADLGLLAETGTSLVANPGSNLRLGNGAPRYAAWRATGVPVALGGDDTELADDGDPWGELRLFAALARDGDRASPPGPGAAERLRIATEGGAHVLGLAGRIGRLTPGFAADVVALDPRRVAWPGCDPAMPLLDLLMARASGRDVRMTMVAGRILYRDGVFTDVDAEAVAAAALRESASARHHPERPASAVEALGRAVLDAYDAG